MVHAVGEAPGKILLVGEHAVVYGHPAIAIPLRSVRARAELEFTRNGGIEVVAPDIQERGSSEEGASPRLAPLVRLAESVLDLFGEPHRGLRIQVNSTIPIGRGMGSGAAVAVAVVRVVCHALDRRLNADQVAELSLEAEKVFHGTPSGVDNAVVSRDEPIYFVRGKPAQTISVGPSVFRFIVADTGIQSPTRRVVAEVRAARERDRARYDSFFWELGSMASMAREVIRTGSPEELGLCMDRAHQVLRAMGVSCAELDRLVSVALENGAIGAKLSGGGRGGAMIAALGRDADEERLASQLRLAGAESIFTTVLSRDSKNAP